MGTNPKLSVGDVAPEFALASDDRGEVSLAGLRGQRVVLYFYPKDMTPGCTTQACDFRDNLGRLEALGYVVFGVSPDSVARHATFREKHGLTFGLLADEDHAVAEAYGVWREKTNYGKTYEGIVRSTFVIDEAGVLVDVQDNVRAKGHVARLVDALGGEG